ncbi:MAG: eukaryotic-like serine/threonine-protein kinase [Acidobacteriota bacterium]|jgi:serine/threonine protein kinase|nr:eukaryotic-like serine/threonine-protein kinase [Acidobacteriota bacterium]
MIAPGTVLQNRYAVERQIGAGGMGAVYVATDRRFGSTVALKETFFDDPALRRAFEREARLLNRLRHSALPRVSDHFEEAEGQFLVMEYIPGEDLSQMLKARNGSGFPARQVLGWADQLLDALDYLHTQEPSVIHRDIKPQNLKLTARDQVVLLDFGLAKGAPLQTRVTNTASLFGYSFNYAPIEQMQGTGTDPRSDLYSLGATLYHLLTSATPPDALTRATAVLNGEPDPLRPASETAAHVPAEVSDVIARAMALSAARRFSSAEEMRAVLREAALAVSETLEASGAATLVPGVESEQKTRLMDSSTARTSAQEPRAAETRPAVAQEAATLLNEGASPTHTSARGAEPTSVEGVDGKSVVTRVRIADASPREHPRRALYVVLGLVCIALAGAGVYSFVQSALPGEPVAQPAPQPTAQSTPPKVPPPSAQQAAEATPTPAATPAAAQKRATAAPTPRSTQPEPEHPAAPEPHAPPAGPELPPEAAGDPALRGRDLSNQPLTREELRQVLRRAAQERRRALLGRDRIFEEQRRQRRLEQQQRRRGVNPYPPAPPPP